MPAPKTAVPPVETSEETAGAPQAPVAVATGAMTPMLRQYLEVKSRYPDALLFFRLGDFYELFYEDAKTAAEILGITLTSRAKGDDRIPMCGVPHHSAKGHVARLVDAGHRVAICDQTEEATPGKSIVRRDVTRVVTPGTVFDEDGREAKTATFLAGLVLDRDKGGALALLEASTGDFRVFAAESDAALLDELLRAEPRELLLDAETANTDRFAWHLLPATRTVRDGREFESRRGFEALCRHFQVASLDGFGLANQPQAWGAAAAVLHYVEETQRSALAHVRQITRYEPTGTLIIDAASRKNLDLVRNSADGRRSGSLLSVIDKTSTAMGGRLLTQWLLYPLTDVNAINLRLDAITEFFESAVLREDITTVLREVSDLERLVSRLVVGQGHGRDVRQLGISLGKLPLLKQLLINAKSALLREGAAGLPDLNPLAAYLVNAMVEEPPATIKEGGIFRRGFNAELDELLDLAASGKDSIARMEADERKRTGIQSLKIRFNRVFGYYIEITKANLANVPSDYVRKQTTANGERYITPWLQEYEGKVLTAEERSIAMEQKLFEELRQHIIQHAPFIQQAAKLIATLDVLLSLARVAADYGYKRPTVNSGDLIRIIEGRHPVVERALGREPFVPNDIEVDHQHRLIVLTGPNMAGKSTAMRQVALITLLAQMGSFVPAGEAVIGVCDRLFTRVGAGDDLARGQSTFMVEMSETANILRHASSRSLVLLDEIGRGTSTFDGLAIAWAVAEHIHDHVRARTIFATHYHELTQLAHEKEHVVNLTMAVREWQDRVVFLRKLVPGAASRSYGVQVARLAGVPAPVLERARQVLTNLEKAGVDESGHAVFAKAARKHQRAQLALGLSKREEAEDLPELTESPVMSELRTVDVDSLTPLQALQLVHRWKSAVNSS